jgi:hypothetical protein
MAIAKLHHFIKNFVVSLQWHEHRSSPPIYALTSHSHDPTIHIREPNITC